MSEFDKPIHLTIPSNEKGRDFIVGDIHGHLKKLQRALDRVAFNPEADRLFSLGDLIDRGKDNVRVLDMLYQNDWFYAIRGNHDQFVVEYFESPSSVVSIYQNLQRSRYEIKQIHMMNGGKWFYKLRDASARERIYQLLSALPYAITLQTPWGDIGLVHAEVPGSCDNWTSFLSKLKLSRELREEATWNRTQIMNAYDPFSNRHVSPRDFIERNVDGVLATVHGHMGVHEPVQCGNQLWIDTGHITGELTIMSVEEIAKRVCEGVQ
ncbi:metallophosphoesterase [Hydrogenovibrio kuenenii]|uniref:metallophosphoesterase n=1 Tax=Hydrogenovibrio kuenenii TaxID=63658 RepID=UPI000467D0A4|nr:metallophosphoesterase [Hydrogenovibrio kuenenii]